MFWRLLAIAVATSLVLDASYLMGVAHGRHLSKTEISAFVEGYLAARPQN